MRKVFKIEEYEKKIVEKELELLETPLYLHYWNGREVLGIIPEYYNYKDGEIQGYKYHCYYADCNDLVSYTLIDDMALLKYKEDHKSLTVMQKVYMAAVKSTGYDGTLTREHFEERYNRYRDHTKLPE